MIKIITTLFFLKYQFWVHFLEQKTKDDKKTQLLIFLSANIV